MTTTIERQRLEEDIKTFYIDKKELEFGTMIGKGGFGIVFSGKYRGRKCAIKSIYVPVMMRHGGGGSEDPYLDFLHEMIVQLQLDHNNLLTTYGWSSDDTCVYVVMELMPYSLSKLLKSTVPEYKFTPKYEDVATTTTTSAGDNNDIKMTPLRKSNSSSSSSSSDASLQNHKKRKKKPRPVILSNQMKLQIALDIAEGMYYLHTREKAIIHRDLKSMNVLLSNDLTCAICDFGFAAIRNQTSVVSGMKGTYGWCSPEMLRMSSVKNGKKCDVYSYGMILYELLTHRVPFYYSNNPFSVTSEVLQGKRSSLEQDLEKDDGQLLKDYDGHDCEIVKALLNLYYSCTEQNPEDRPDFLDIIYELQNVPVSTKIQYLVDPEVKSSSVATGTFSTIQAAIDAIPNIDEQIKLLEKQSDSVNQKSSAPDVPQLQLNMNPLDLAQVKSGINKPSLPTPRSNFVKSTNQLRARNFVDLEELKQKARAMLFSKVEVDLEEDIPSPSTATSTASSLATPGSMASPRTPFPASPRTPTPLDSPNIASELRPISRRRSVMGAISPLTEENIAQQKEKHQALQLKKRQEEQARLQKSRLIDKRTGLPYTLDEQNQKVILSNNTLKPPLIKIRPGVYRESIVIDKNVQLIGIESDNQGVIIELPNPLISALVTVQSCTSGTIQNITFFNPNSRSPVVKITGRSHAINLTKCRFKSVQLEVDDFSEPVVSKCSIIGCNLSTGGLYIHNDSKGHYFDNSFCANTGANIVISHNADPLIEFNDIYKSKSVGILCAHQGKGWITRNEIYENQGHGIQIHTRADPIIEHNEIDQNMGRGIDCGYMSAGTIRNNNISKNDICPQVKVNDNSSVYIGGNNRIIDGGFASDDEGSYIDDDEDEDTDSHPIRDNNNNNKQSSNSNVNKGNGLNDEDGDDYTYSDAVTASEEFDDDTDYTDSEDYADDAAEL